MRAYATVTCITLFFLAVVLTGPTWHCQPLQQPSHRVAFRVSPHGVPPVCAWGRGWMCTCPIGSSASPASWICTGSMGSALISSLRGSASARLAPAVLSMFHALSHALAPLAPNLTVQSCSKSIGVFSNALLICFYIHGPICLSRIGQVGHSVTGPL